MNKAVQLIILIVVAERTAELSRVVFVYILRIHYITNAEDIIHSIILAVVVQPNNAKGPYIFLLFSIGDKFFNKRAVQIFSIHFNPNIFHFMLFFSEIIK